MDTPSQPPPQPRERAKSMGHLSFGAMSTPVSEIKRLPAVDSPIGGNIMATSLPLPSILGYFRRNSSVQSSNLGSCAESMSSISEDSIDKGMSLKVPQTNRKFSLQEVIIPEMLPKSTNTQVTSPSVRKSSLQNVFSWLTTPQIKIEESSPSLSDRLNTSPLNNMNNMADNDTDFSLTKKKVKLNARDFNFCSPTSF